jgi:uncharacterized protein
MMYAPAFWDFALLAALAGGFLVDLACKPLFRKSKRAGYFGLMAYLWILAFGVIALWSLNGRSWALLLLPALSWWRAGIGFAVFGVYLWLSLSQRRAILQRPALRGRVRDSLGGAALLVPETDVENRWWVAVSITAGTTEEVLFRGFAVLVLTQFAGPAVAVLVSAILFGISHLSFGPRNALGAGAFGLAMSVIAIGSTSLLPVMAIHIAQDLTAAQIGRFALEDENLAVSH